MVIKDVTGGRADWALWLHLDTMGHPPCITLFPDTAIVDLLIATLSIQEMFRDEMSKDDWRLVVKLKKVFKID